LPSDFLILLRLLAFDERRSGPDRYIVRRAVVPSYLGWGSSHFAALDNFLRLYLNLVLWNGGLWRPLVGKLESFRLPDFRQSPCSGRDPGLLSFLSSLFLLGLFTSQAFDALLVQSPCRTSSRTNHPPVFLYHDLLYLI
jgi:hypothetical protein